MAQKRISIVGGGLVGSLMAIYLAKKGHRVDVYERRADMRSADISAGRSINLAMSDRGWRGLERAGIIDHIKPIAIPMAGRMMHDRAGNLSYQAYGESHQAINSVSRRTLNVTLMDCADAFENVNFHFNERALDVDIDRPSVAFENTLSGEQHTVESDVVIGSDGAFSAIRGRMQHLDRFNFSQSYLDHGYKELTIPPGPNGEFMLDKNALHIWARHSFMLIALANVDATFTCTLFYPFKGEQSFEHLNTEQDVLNLFNTEFADVVPLMPTLIQDFFGNPTGSLATMRAYPWAWQDKIALIGDAAHAVVPFYGQGMNCGFEDCVCLSDCLDAYPDDWSTAFDTYQKLRKPNADAIAQMAIENFVEMRDKVADPKFLLRKKIEAMMAREFPSHFATQYSLVSFSADTPYVEAFERGRANDALFEQIMDIPDITTTWQSESVKQCIAGMLGISSSN